MSADSYGHAAGTAGGLAPAGTPSRAGAAVGAGPGLRSGPGRSVIGALVRPILYAGVERPVIALEGALGAGILAAVGPRLVTLVVVAAIVGVVHPLMAWLTAQDPMATAVYARQLGWRDYYPPHGGPRAKSRVRPTLPPLA